MKLTIAKLKALAPGRRLFVGEGLFLFCTPTGVKSWRMQPRVDGRRLTVVLGRWPDVPLDQAREAARRVREQVKLGQHPTVERTKARHANVAAQRASVQSLFDDHLAVWSPQRSKAWLDNATRWWQRYLQPEIGSIPARDVTGLMILAAMEAARAATSLHAAHAVRQLAAAVLDRAVALGHLPANPARSLARALPPHAPGQHKTATLADARALWQALDDYPGEPGTVAATRLLILTALRVSEVTSLLVGCISAANATMTLPRASMKVKTASRGDFIVPLSRQARAALPKVKAGYLFPGHSTRGKPLHKSAINNAFNRMGFDFSPHSIRNAFSTTAHERELAAPEVIEAALDHARGSAISRAYNRGSLLAQRAVLMQKWAGLVLKR